jgi:N-acetylglucosaminyl-diphospho-decaprenol L-rhamnosyltransferase
MSTSVDVVLVVYGQYEFADSCLRHLRAQTLEHRLIVVDDCSPDDTVARLRGEWPDVQLVRMERNGGYPIACNRGVAMGSGEIVVILNSDVDCRPDFLERIVAPFEDPAVGSVASLVLQRDGRSIDSVGVTADVTLAGFRRLHGMSPERASDSRPLLTGPEGTAAAYRRTAWEQIGGFDEAILAHMDIFDLALRLRDAGWQAASALDAISVHYGSATFGKKSRFQRRLAGFGRGYLLRRYGVLRRQAALRTVVTEGVVVVADTLMSRDLSALRGRVAGWRAGRGYQRRPWPPHEAIDAQISFRDSMALRRRAY